MFYKGFIFTNLTSFTGLETVTSYTGLDGFSCLLFNKLNVDLNEKVDKISKDQAYHPYFN